MTPHSAFWVSGPIRHSLSDGKYGAYPRRINGEIKRSGEHLLSLINDVLDVAKIEAGRMVLEVSAFDLKSLVWSVIDMMHVRAAETRLDLSLVEGAGVPGFVRTDSSRLRQALINLVGNAIQYTERGSVTVSLQARPAGDGRGTCSPSWWTIPEDAVHSMVGNG